MAEIGQFMNQIIQGDCLDVMRELPKQSVNVILTDPPYFLPAVYYETRRVFKRNFADLGILESFFRQWFAEVGRVLTADGRLLMFCDGQIYPLFYYYAYFIMKSVRPLIWDKQTSINGYYWRHQHELILFGTMQDAPVIPTGDGDILRFNAVPVDERLHPAQKPLDLVMHLVERTSVTGDIILDPFLGSGTTTLACEKLGRTWLGIDVSSDYCEIARKRVEPWLNQSRLGEVDVFDKAGV